MIEDHDEVMCESAEELASLVVGKRIVSATEREYESERWGFGYKETGLVVTLDDGTEFAIGESSDCCAYTALESFLINPEAVDHVITSVSTENDYQVWRIIADGRDVVKMDVSWSEGSGYYMYGFEFHTIKIKDEA